jgi:hypothetical protein
MGSGGVPVPPEPGELPTDHSEQVRAYVSKSLCKVLCGARGEAFRGRSPTARQKVSGDARPVAGITAPVRSLSSPQQPAGGKPRPLS